MYCYFSSVGVQVRIGAIVLPSPAGFVMCCYHWSLWRHRSWAVLSGYFLTQKSVHLFDTSSRPRRVCDLTGVSPSFLGNVSLFCVPRSVYQKEENGRMKEHIKWKDWLLVVASFFGQILSLSLKSSNGIFSFHICTHLSQYIHLSVCLSVCLSVRLVITTFWPVCLFGLKPQQTEGRKEGRYGRVMCVFFSHSLTCT